MMDTLTVYVLRVVVVPAHVRRLRDEKVTAIGEE